MELLEEIVAGRTAAVQLLRRTQIVVLAFRTRNNEEVGEWVGLNPQSVSVWRKRWKADWERLIAVECSESRSVLKHEIESLLADQPRKRRTPNFSPEQQAAIVALACEDPDDESERPISRFTHREMIRPTRTKADFLANIDGFVQTASDAHWRVVTDSINTHGSKSLVVSVAKTRGIDTDLGAKGR